MLVVGYIYGLVGEVPGREEHKASPRPFALLWAVSSLTGLGAVSPNNSDGGLLFATFFVVVGVPLNAAFLAMIVDIYLSYVQRTEARRKVLANPLGRATFFDIAATRSTLEPNAGGEWPRVVTWPVYLEHKLRELASERTTLSDALLDTIHESFLAMGGRKGYLMLDDLAGEESAEVAALAGGAHGGVGTGGSLSGSFCDGGPLTPNSRARSWHGVNDASSPMRHLDEQLQQHIRDSPDHHV